MTALLKTMYRPCALWAAACIGLLITTSCTDNELDKRYAKMDQVSFGISISDGWNMGIKTRSMSKDELLQHEVYKFGDSDLWIISSEEEKITESGFAEDKIQTRGVPVTNEEEFANVHTSFGVCAYYSEDDDFASPVSYISCEEIKSSRKSTSAVLDWLPQSTHFWPASGYMKFYAYAPYSINESVKQESGGLHLQGYVVHGESTEQPDILIALPQDPENTDYYTCSDHSIVSLKFRHALTAVKVKASTNLDKQIQMVKISGVMGKGTLVFDSVMFNVSSEAHHGIEDTFCWKDLSATSTDFTATLNGKGYDHSYIVSEESTFMMIPQKLTDQATLTVIFDDGSQISGKIGGGSHIDWKMGNTVTYLISKSSIESEFEVTTNQKPVFTYNGTEGAYIRVTSHETGGGNKNLGWTVQFSTDDGKTWTDEAPKTPLEDTPWCTGISNTPNPTYYYTDVLYKVSAQTSIVTSTDSHDLILQSKEPLGSKAAPYNLASSTGGNSNERTANCYLINAAGTYSLPLVYGNAIKNGTTNISAYTSNVNGNNQVLKIFKNHLDKEIKNPYIYENEDDDHNKLTANKACLVWQDKAGLITDVSLSEDKKTLVFTTAEKSSIKVGNAVVAVKDQNDKIMWSWHIWVTDYILGEGDVTVTNKDNMKYQFMAQNIGNCSSTTQSYEGRAVKVKFIQEKTGKKQFVTIIQQPYMIRETPGNQPYFQFGRKDPFPPYEGSGDKKADFRTEYIDSKKGVTLGYAIQNPDLMFLNEYNYSYQDWCSSIYLNLWSADNVFMSNAKENTNIVGKKTIYDPSPVGYCVPPLGAFSGFTFDGGQNSHFSYINTPFNYFENATDHKGWVFYCNPMTENMEKDESSETIFFSGTGYRFYNSGNVLYYNQAAIIWASTPGVAINNNSNHQGGCLFCAYYNNNDKRVAPCYNYEKTYASIVRPIKEQ